MMPYSETDGLISFAGHFGFEVRSRHGDLLSKGIFKNANPLAALNHALDIVLAAGTQVTQWYFGLINNSPTPTLSTSDTMASHAGWAEFTNYTEATRQQWSPGSVSGQLVTNPTVATCTMDTGGGSLYGAFIVGNSTKGGTSGILWATGAFPAVQTLSVGQVISLTYSSTAAAA